MSDELPSPLLLELDAALKRLPAIIRPVTAHTSCPLDKAMGRITAHEIMAPYDLPPFDNTGVDGYAFRHADYRENGLRLAGQSLAGEPFRGVLPQGAAVHIATGAVLPSGADTVVMQEHVRTERDRITMDPVPEKGANIRRKGADIGEKAPVLAARHRLKPQDIALLGGLGFETIDVLRPLRIGILATGAELKPAGSRLDAGQIIDTNSLMLKQLLSTWPVTLTMLGALPDERAATDTALIKAASSHDLVISTGGVSVGRRDFIRDALQELGRVHFWKLALRPGRPVMFGEIDECLMLGLPGNPVSVLVTFYLVARSVILALLGMTPALPAGYDVCLAETIRKEKHLRSFPRVRLEVLDGQWQAIPFADQSSNLVSSLVRSDGLLDLPLGQTCIKAGTPVTFRPYTVFD